MEIFDKINAQTVCTVYKAVIFILPLNDLGTRLILYVGEIMLVVCLLSNLLLRPVFLYYT